MKTDKHGKQIPSMYCSCGRQIYGNGAWSAHRKMHRRRDDGHHALTRDQFDALLRGATP